MKPRVRLLPIALLSVLSPVGVRSDPGCSAPVLDFTAPRSFAFEGNPRSLAAADLDGDGHADVAAVNGVQGFLQPPSVAVFTGDGRGAFSGPASYPLIELRFDESVFEGPAIIATSDLDGDGRLDLIVTGNLSVTGRIPLGGARVLPGLGEGEFGRAVEVACNFNAYDVVAADLDADGAPDLALANPESQTISILLSDGNRTFKPEKTIPSLRDPVALMAMDLDGDGVLDLATANRGSSDALVLIGRGDGSFAPVGSFYTRNQPAGIAGADLDADGLPELVTIGQEGAASILPGTGQGSFGRATVLSTGLFAGQGLVAGDLDADGIGDLAFSGLGWLSAFRGLGGGRFGAPALLPAGGGNTPVRADLDEDGLPDLLLGAAAAEFAFQALLNRSGQRPAADCDGNGLADACEIAEDPRKDADGDALLDACEAVRPAMRDCNRNGRDDGEDLVSGASPDCNRNGLPDECEFQPDRLDLGDAPSFPTGRGPREVRTADLDGDGEVDVATADEAGTLSVLLGRGDGTLEPARSLALGEDGRAVAISDLNRDGELDLIGADQRDLVVFRGTGGGAFEEASRLSPDVPALSVAAVDLDGDGLVDLATSNGVYTPDAGARVLLGNGDGTFRAGWTARFETYGTLVAADFDGDAKVDLALRGIWQIGTFRGRGDGTFGEALRIGIEAIGLAAGDIDGDGRADLAASRYDPSLQGIVILHGRPDGSFLSSRVRVDGFVPWWPLLQDLDGDGKADLAVATQPDGVAVFRQAGSGLLAPPVLSAAGARPYSLAAADLDGDAAMDLAAGCAPEGAGFVSVLRGDGTGAFRAGSVLTTLDIETEFTNFFVSDLDADGTADLLGASAINHRVAASLGNGDGTYQAPVTTGVSQNLWVGAAGDFDGDALPDVLLSDLRVLRGKGDAGFLIGPKASIDLGDWVYVAEWATADLDGDGRLDLVRIDGSKVHVYLNRGAFAFEAPDDPYSLGSGAEDVLVADLDNDAIADLVATGADHDEVWVVSGLSQGRFIRPARRYALGDPGGPRLRPSEITAADLDRDGFPEIITADFEGESVSVFPGSAEAPGVPRRYPVGVQVESLAAGDLDEDGIPDIAAGGNEPLGLAILLSTGEGSLAPARMLDAGPSHLAIFDADGDGRNDLLAASRPGFDAPVNLVLFRNRSLPLAGDCNANRVPDSCDITGGKSRDADGNGVPDECEPDCDGDTMPDSAAIGRGLANDCNLNGVPDRCDLADAVSRDVDGNGVPDECEPDCDRNGIPDAGDIASGTARDCNGNGFPDHCDLADGSSRDLDSNGVPDDCQADCNRNGIPDPLDLEGGGGRDCDGNEVLDECQIAANLDLDLDRNGVLDGCEPDCNRNGLPDALEISLEYVPDCNANSIPDSCDIAAGRTPDCNQNGIPDACDIAGGLATDTDSSGVPDSCEGGWQVPGDCDGDGKVSLSDAVCLLGALYLGTPDRLPCGNGSTTAPSNLTLLDWQGEGRVDITDAIGLLSFLFLGGPGHQLTAESSGPSGCLTIFGCPANPACGL